MGIFSVSEEQRNELFPRKPIQKIREEEGVKKVSLLTEILAKFPNAPENPFKEFAKWDGNVIFLIALYLKCLET